MKKEVPAQSSNYILPEKDFNKRIDKIFDEIYSEKPEYWENGLNRDLFTGLGDKIILLSDKDKDMGFIGFQKYRRAKNNKLGTAVSVGILPEYRGKGLAREVLTQIIPEVIKPQDGDIIWSCHKDNKPSQKLCEWLMKQKNSIPNNFILQLDSKAREKL